MVLSRNRRRSARTNRPVFNDGWMMDGKGPFMKLHAYGETLDCLNKLLVERRSHLPSRCC